MKKLIVKCYDSKIFQNILIYFPIIVAVCFYIDFAVNDDRLGLPLSLIFIIISILFYINWKVDMMLIVMKQDKEIRQLKSKLDGEHDE